MKQWFFCLGLVVGLFGAYPLLADPDLDHALTVQVARKTLGEVMLAIARDIGDLRGEFPQLKKWHKAKVSSSRIEYQYHYTQAEAAGLEEEFKKNGCTLLIYTKDQAELVSASNALPDLKVGVYLKLKAVGKRAEELKQAIQHIIAKRFESIRNLHSTFPVE